MPISVVDDHANVEEILQSMARVLGTDKVRRSVFSAIYGRHTRPADIDRILEIAKLEPRQKQQARNALTKLASNKIIIEIPPDGENGFRRKHYKKSPWVNARRKRLLDLADDKQNRESLPTKRSSNNGQGSQSLITKIVYQGVRIRVSELTVDDLDSFDRVRGIASGSSLLRGMSEETFKTGIQSIIGEHGTFKDWGGEKSDLLSTRLVHKGKRVATAFAFKGPGQPGALTPARMGKNGDQALRLFEEVADLYVVQHWREIASSVRALINSLAVAHSVMRNKTIYYCFIDGGDSQRIVSAYPNAFE